MPFNEDHADLLWILVCTALVMLMQGGFCLLESGMSRAKNSINVALKNLADFCVAVLLYWVVGFGLMFGASESGLLGTSLFGPSLDGDPWLIAFFLFQVVFCGTATTIISGAIAERTRFVGYLVVSVFVSGLLYPVFGHWAWGGIVPGTGQGWLAQLGFVDFAGSTVVHSLGGWAALAAVLVVGPRLGRFSPKRRMITGHSLPLAVMGTILLWFGWFGFNGGSTLAINATVPGVLLTTNLAAAAGGLGALAWTWLTMGRSDVGSFMNGVIAGLVAITACCHVVAPGAAIIIGMTASVMCMLGCRALIFLKIDDVIGAVPAHAVAGAWGTLCVALFGDLVRIGTGLSRWEQLGVQAAGVSTCFVWGFGLSYLVLLVLNQVVPLRVSRKSERQGLNFAEHGATTELIDLLSHMDRHRRGAALSRRVPVEPHTEVGQIAAEYNRVLQRVNTEITCRELAMSAAQEAEERFRDIFENAFEGIYQTTPQGHYLAANPALARIYGFDTVDELLASVTDVSRQLYVDPSRRETFVTLMEQNGRITDFESEVYRRDGEIITIRESARRVCDENGRVLYYEGSVEDVTEQKLAAQLQRDRDAADARDKAKSSFLANMSHEIRTPLNGVVGMLELLTRTELQEKQERYVRIAMSSANTLLSLINDVLDFSKIEAGKLDLEQIPFELATLIEDVAEMFSHRAAEKGLELTCFVRPGVPPRVVGDPERLRQILVNLIGNALKFTQQGEVRIEVEQDRQQPFLLISVADTGIGMSEEQQQQLFKPFSQVDTSTTRQFGGTGLGLAISGQLAELMGGAISVESEPGVGSVFTCRVPLPSIDAPEPLLRRPAVLSAIRVLAVDDNETNREILAEQLSNWGIAVDVFEQPAIALQKLREAALSGHPYRIAILDQHMPDLTGLEIAREVRREPRLNETRLMLLSSVDQIVERSQLGALGIDACMTKPIRQSMLFDILIELASDRCADRPREDVEAGSSVADSFPSGARILVAEDNDVNQMVIEELLGEFDLECEVVNNGAKVLQKLNGGTFDLILMDCQMPELDGFEATRRIREMEAAGELAHASGRYPIIALTANAIKGDRERCLAAGMDDYVSKPIDPVELREKIVAALAASNNPGSASADDRENGLVVDVEQLLRRCLGKQDLANRVLKKLSDRLPGDLDSIAGAVQAGDWPKVRQLTHALKGAAANVAAVRLSEVALQLETGSSNADGERIARTMQELRAAADAYRKYVIDYLLSNAGQDVPDSQQVEVPGV